MSADEVRLRRVVSAHIERVLEATDHNLSLAADLLGMNRRSLQRYARRKQERPKRKRRAAKKR
ncbi:MAG TPA: helix-turn-helix domain-containing protein [Polyangia bacterium]